MKLRSLDIRNFRSIRQLHVDFGPGLNVLYGPNELGKSTMIEALRAAFLLPVNSKIAEDFVPWGTDETPEVVVEFELPTRDAQESSGTQLAATGWRIKKSFGSVRNQSAYLEKITGLGRSIEKARGRDVDGQLRCLLNWGIQEPGGRGAPRGWPQSYLVTALLGEQDSFAKIFESSLDSDGADSGRSWLTSALGVLAQAPEVTTLLERLNLRTQEVFTDKGQKRRTQDSPLVRITDRKRTQQNKVEKLEDEQRRSQEIESQISDFRKQQQSVDSEVSNLTRRTELLAKAIEIGKLLTESKNRTAKLNEAVGEYKESETQLKSKSLQRQELHGRLEAEETTLAQTKAKLAGLEARLQQLHDTRGESLNSRRQHLEALRTTARQNANGAQRSLDASREAEKHQVDFNSALQKSEEARSNRHQAAIVLSRAFQASVQNARDQVVQAQSVSTLAKLKSQREQLIQARAAVNSAQQEYERLNRETKQVEAEVGILKSERTNLQKTRNQSLDAAKQVWEQRQKHADQRRLLDDELRRMENSEHKARRLLNILDVLDEAEQRLSVTKEKQSDLIANRKIAEQNCSLLREELGVVTGNASRLQMIMISSIAGAFLILAMGLVIDSIRVAFLTAFGILGVGTGLLAVRWRALSNKRTNLIAERDAMRQAVDRLVAQSLIADSELAAAQRDLDTSQRSVLEELRERFDNPTTARSWLEQELRRKAETRSRLVKEIAELDVLTREQPGSSDDSDHTAALDSRIHDLDDRIVAIEKSLQSLRTQRDQAQTRLEQTVSIAIGDGSVSDNDFINSSDNQLQIFDSQIAQCIQQLGLSDNQIVPKIEDAEHSLTLARQNLLTTTSAYELRIKSLLTEVSSGSHIQSGDDQQLGLMPILSVEDAEQQWRFSRDHEAEVLNELKQREAELKAKKTTANQLAQELGKPAAEVLHEANQIVTEVTLKLSELESGRDSNIECAATDRDIALKEVSEHQRVVTQLKDNLKVLDEEVIRLQEVRDAVKTARDKVEEHARHLDAERIESELRNIEQQLFREIPDLEISVEQLELSRRKSNFALAEQEHIHRSLHEARGKLELSGGEALRDQLESARSELERIEAEAIEQELEYDAMYYLQQNLQKVSKQHSAHLGKSLAQPVRVQFRELTGNRYTDLHFDPDLQLKMVTAQSSERPRDAMSVGTRQQLATLIRLALGAQLETTVVLDDQLVHSDAERLVWFRECIRKSVEKNPLQVVVVTCRPQDYITAQEFDMAKAAEVGSEHENFRIISFAYCLT